MEEILKERLGKWYGILRPEFDKTYMHQLNARIKNVKENHGIVLPKKENIFRAFQECGPDDTKVVIIGQDPYPHEHANGLAFSSLEDKTPASLRNIFEEIDKDIGLYIERDNNLQRWAEQGVLLLNTVLTVSAGFANSHQGFGWEQFTGHVINYLSKLDQPIVWILWGRYAQTAYDRYSETKEAHPMHKILSSVHPSPMSAHNGFFGSKPFSKTNEFLEKHGKMPIDWRSPKMPW